MIFTHMCVCVCVIVESIDSSGGSGRQMRLLIPIVHKATFFFSSPLFIYSMDNDCLMRVKRKNDTVILEIQSDAIYPHSSKSFRWVHGTSKSE